MFISPRIFPKTTFEMIIFFKSVLPDFNFVWRILIFCGAVYIGTFYPPYPYAPTPLTNRERQDPKPPLVPSAGSITSLNVFPEKPNQTKRERSEGFTIFGPNLDPIPLPSYHHQNAALTISDLQVSYFIF